MTVMFNWPSSRASDRVKPDIDALVALYTESPVYPVKLTIDEMLTMRPPPPVIIERTTYFVSRRGDSVLSRTSASMSVSRMVASKPLVPMPALFTRP